MGVSKNQIKLVRSLRQKKFRDETGLFVAEGLKLVNELRSVFPLELWIDQENATRTEIEQMSSLCTPQGVIAVFRQRPKTPTAIDPSALTLVLDGIQDPGNMGTIIRTADWFGVRHIVCSHLTADCYSPKVVQATMGALARVHVAYTDLTDWLTKATQAGLPVYGTLLNGRNIYTEPLTAAGVVIMGNEGAGLSAETRRFVTAPLLIPSYPPETQTSESLNVGIATALTLAEFRRSVR